MYSCLCKVAKTLSLHGRKTWPLHVLRAPQGPAPQGSALSNRVGASADLSAGDGVRLRGGFMQDAIGLENGRPADGRHAYSWSTMIPASGSCVQRPCVVKATTRSRRPTGRRDTSAPSPRHRTSRCSTCKCPSWTVSASRRHYSRTSARNSSGSSSPATRILVEAQAYEAGALGFLAKPFDPRDFGSFVNRALAHLAPRRNSAVA